LNFIDELLLYYLQLRCQQKKGGNGNNNYHQTATELLDLALVVVPIEWFFVSTLQILFLKRNQKQKVG